MAAVDGEVLNLLKSFKDPYCQSRDIVARGGVKSLVIEGSHVVLTLALGYPAETEKMAIIDAVKSLILSSPAVESVDVSLEWGIVPHKTQNNLESLHRIKNIIAVASGKGGVGKSTVSVNLALALAQEGARVGILDADIYGPSQGAMLNIPENQRPDFVDGDRFKPIEAYGIQSMSMAYMVTEKTPMVWRGPMVSGALLQLLNQCTWNDLDYLIVDMPPGTGDIQLTLAQKVPVTGAVIVTTPQEIALLDAQKGIEMFQKTDIPVLGVIENMALHTCSQCGHQEPIFGEGGGIKIAEGYDTELLASLPLALSTREAMDKGIPPVIAEPDGQLAQTFRTIAKKVTGNLAATPTNERQTSFQTIATDR